MIKHLSESRDGLVAIKSIGKLEESDYYTIVPEFEEKIQQHVRINLYWEIETFDESYKPTFWSDLFFNLKHATDLKKIALVGDKKNEEAIINLMKPFTGAEIRYFDLSQRQQAMDWVKN